MVSDVHAPLWRNLLEFCPVLGVHLRPQRCCQDELAYAATKAVDTDIMAQDHQVGSQKRLTQPETR